MTERGKYWLLVFSIISLLCLLIAPSRAQSDYSTDDVIKHFMQEASKLSKKRALCIGTRDECDWKKEQAEDLTGGFNLTVTFRFGSAELTDQAKENLDVFAEALSDDRMAIARFAIEGHTDSVGSDTANIRLSEKRARAVARYLVSSGVELTKLEIKGHGETALAHPENPEHEGNRRVEARLLLD